MYFLLKSVAAPVVFVCPVCLGSEGILHAYEKRTHSTVSHFRGVGEGAQSSQ